MSTSPRRPLPSRTTAPTSPSRPVPRRLGEGPNSPPRTIVFDTTSSSVAPTSPSRPLPASIISTVSRSLPSNKIAPVPTKASTPTSQAPTSPSRPLPRRITEPIRRTVVAEPTPVAIRETTPDLTSPRKPLPSRISGSSSVNAPVSPSRTIAGKAAPRPAVVVTRGESSPVVAPVTEEKLTPERSLTFRLEGGKITNVRLVDSTTIVLTVV